jgi:hypothetical protein
MFFAFFQSPIEQINTSRGSSSGNSEKNQSLQIWRQKYFDGSIKSQI